MLPLSDIKELAIEVKKWVVICLEVFVEENGQLVSLGF